MRLQHALRLLMLCIVACSTMASAQSGGELTTPQVDRRIEQINQSGGADTQALTDRYAEVQRWLDQAESFGRDESAYLDSLVSAPQEQAKIQSRLDAADLSAEPEDTFDSMDGEALAARLAQARTEYRELETRRQELDARLAGRESTAAAIRDRLSEVEVLLQTQPVDDLAFDPAGSPSLAEADAWVVQAQSQALRAEVRAKVAQLESQAARFNVFRTQRSEIELKLGQLESLIEALEARQMRNSSTRSTLAEIGIPESDRAWPIANRLAEAIDATLQQNVALNDRLAEVRALNGLIEDEAASLQEKYATAKRIVEFAGDSNIVGQVLMTYWDEVGRFGENLDVGELSQEAGNTVISRIGIEEKLGELASASSYVNNQLRQSGIDPSLLSDSTQAVLRQLVQRHRDELNALSAAQSELIDELALLETSKHTQATAVGAYQDFLESLVLWIPNHPPLWQVPLRAAGIELQQIRDQLSEIRPRLNAGVWAIWLLAGVVFLLRRPATNLQRSFNTYLARPRDDSLRYTVFALMAAAVRCLPVPLAVYGLGYAIGNQTPVASELGGTLSMSALVYFSLDLMRVLCEPEGIGQHHFRWRQGIMEPTHAELSFFIRWLLPWTILVAVVVQITPDSGDGMLSRLAMLGIALLLGMHWIRFVLRKRRSLPEDETVKRISRLTLLASIIFVGAAFAVVWGQVLSIQIILGALIDSIWAGIGIFLVHALLLRWLQVARRRLRFAELVASRQQQAATEESPVIEDNVAALGDISNETHQLVNALTAAATIVLLAPIWRPLFPVFDGLDRITLWSSTSVVEGETVVNQITLWTVLAVVALAALTLYAAKRIPAVVEIILRHRTTVSPGARYTTSTLLNYVIVGGGIIAGLSALGLQWSQLQWLVAALGVGIGFGLQEIVANFISGLIILFERPIRVGDVVTVGDKDGTVTRIRIRATTIRDWDGKELLVPNKEFITGHLLNWTLSDSQTRVVIPIGIAYGSDVEKALAILYDVIVKHPNTLAEPEPLIVFEHFGDNALELTARCFLDSLEGRMKVMTELRVQINLAFEAEGIVIAFPQRDVHLDGSLVLQQQGATPQDVSDSKS